MEPEQAVEIARLGVDAIGFICVRSSPRYVTPHQIQAMSCTLIDASFEQVERVGVFANADLATLAEVIETAHLTTLQLHGQESPEVCAQIHKRHPDLRVIKAFRIRSEADLLSTLAYETVDMLLLDAYHPQLLGGTGQTLNWQLLKMFQPTKPWLLAGGITPNNVQDALSVLSPNGIDVSSGVETSPGNKCLEKVRNLLNTLRRIQNTGKEYLPPP